MITQLLYKSYLTKGLRNCLKCWHCPFHKEVVSAKPFLDSMKPSLFRTRLPLATLAALAFFTPVASLAATLQGRVSEAGLAGSLQGVIISVDGTTFSTTTDRSGRYVMSQIPIGEVNVVFDYVGSPSVITKVKLPSEDSVVTLDAVLETQVVMVDDVVVSAYATGTARAVNIQRSAENYKDVVAFDSFRQFPDGNAAEALNRIPGISIERDQGEGRFVVIRGIDPNLNVVAIDGVVLASPSAEERKIILDTISLEVLNNLEVSKTTLPDQPGDAIGGYIELSSPSAFDHDGPTARASTAFFYSELADGTGGEASFSVGDRLGADQRWGIIVSSVYSTRDFGSDNVEADDWEAEADSRGNDVLITEEFTYRDYDLTRERIGVNANLEFRPGDTNRYFLRAGFNQYRDDEERQELSLEIEDDIDNATFTGTGPNSFSAADVEAQRALKLREEFLRIFVLSAGAEHRPGDWIIDYTAALSMAEEDTPDDMEIVYELDGSAEADFTGVAGVNPRVAFTGGDDPTIAGNFEFDELEQAEQFVEERDLSLKLNLRRDLAAEFVRYVKFGGLARLKTKENDEEIFEADDNPAFADTLANFSNNGLRDFLGTGVPGISPSFGRFWTANRADFDMTRVDEDSVVADYETDENVYAAYVMTSLKFGKTSAIVGARVEHTEYSTNGFSYDADTDVVTPVSASKDYTNVLPGLHLRHDATKDLIFRASVNQAISRPGFEQASPGIVYDGGDESRGNPDLDPYQAVNLDLSIRYYGEKLGIFSAAVFQKDIKDFIYAQTIPGAARDGGDLETFLNGDSGSILGLELAYQRALVAGFGFAVSGTWSDGEATVLGAEVGDPDRNLSIVKQSDFIGQVAFTFEHKGLFARLGYTYRSAYLDEIGEEALEDRYIDDFYQLDFYGSYAFSRRWKVYAELNNLTDSPLEAYWGESGRLSQYEKYGVSGTVGLKWQY